MISVSLHYESSCISSICKPCKQTEAKGATKAKLSLSDLAHTSAYDRNYRVSQAAESGRLAGASHRLGIAATFLGHDPSADCLCLESSTSLASLCIMTISGYARHEIKTQHVQAVLDWRLITHFFSAKLCCKESFLDECSEYQERPLLGILHTSNESI